MIRMFENKVVKFMQRQNIPVTPGFGHPLLPTLEEDQPMEEECIPCEELPPIPYECTPEVPQSEDEQLSEEDEPMEETDTTPLEELQELIDYAGTLKKILDEDGEDGGCGFFCWLLG